MEFTSALSFPHWLFVLSRSWVAALSQGRPSLPAVVILLPGGSRLPLRFDTEEWPANQSAPVSGDRVSLFKDENNRGRPQQPLRLTDIGPSSPPCIALRLSHFMLHQCQIGGGLYLCQSKILALGLWLASELSNRKVFADCFLLPYFVFFLLSFICLFLVYFIFIFLQCLLFWCRKIVGNRQEPMWEFNFKFKKQVCGCISFFFSM